MLSELVGQGLVYQIGSSKNTNYQLSNLGTLLYPINPESDLAEDRLQNPIIYFNSDIFDWLSGFQFDLIELERLQNSAKKYQNKLQTTTPELKKKELERLVIEFSWKSSSFEGDTYTLLETVNLLQNNIKNTSKSSEDAQIILNHKKALEFVFQNTGYFKVISIKKIQELHNLLIFDLGVQTGFRKGGVGILGSLYQPIDNPHIIVEMMEKFCGLINRTESYFAKAMLVGLLVSYVQPFEDGNKRTSRLLANAILHSLHLPLLSYRNTTIEDYRNSVLGFYEQNSIVLFKNIFVEQIEFCANHYF